MNNYGSSKSGSDLKDNEIWKTAACNHNDHEWCRFCKLDSTSVDKLSLSTIGSFVPDKFMEDFCEPN